MGMLDYILVKVCLRGQTELEHDAFIVRQRIEALEKFDLEQGFGLFFIRDIDINFGFQDWNQAKRQDFLAQHELLGHNGLNTNGVGRLDDGPHFGPKHVLLDGLFQEIVQFGHGLHQLDAIFFGGEALVHLDKGHDSFDRPEVLPRRKTFNFAVHCILEQNGTQHLVAREGFTGNDACAHFVHRVEHAFFARGIFIIRHTIGLECFRGTTPTLI
mmetsp:Transcript_4238/g.8624  ORF Transcript_4238/g.8624 Transcript_4238/m.8624 type:complete len:214 (-) Transcript_4238:310-951(-)